jgi:hypothetical protein
VRGDLAAGTDRDVAAEAHDAIDAGPRHETGGEEIRRVRLADGAEVDDDARRHADGAARVHADLLPRAHACRHRHRGRPVVHLQLGEVAVVPEGLQRAPDRRIHEPVALARGAQRRLQRRDQQQAHPHPRPGRRVRADEVGVGPEPAVRPVHLVEQRLRLPAGVAERVRAGDHQLDVRAESRPAVGGVADRRLRGSGRHDPVDDTGGGVLVGGADDDEGAGPELVGAGAELMGGLDLELVESAADVVGAAVRCRARLAADAVPAERGCFGLT